MKKTLLLITLLLNTAFAHAGGYVTGLYSGGVKIKAYLVHNDGGMTIYQVQGVLKNPDACANGNLLYIPATAPGSKQMVSAVMAAVASGKSVGFYSQKCVSVPHWGLTGLEIRNLWVFSG